MSLCTYTYTWQREVIYIYIYTQYSVSIASSNNKKKKKRSRMLGSNKSFVFQHEEAESDERTHFNKSLQELGDLRSQLHNAADYCEATFLNAPHKQIVIDTTKEYLCQAVVTVIDHLGSVSANLDHQISKTDLVLETEQRIDCLKQKLTTCQQYSHKLALCRLCWNANIPRYHPRYIMQPIPNLQRSNATLRESDDAPSAKTTIVNQDSDKKEELPLLSYKYKPLLVQDSTIDIGVKKRIGSSTPVLPVQDGLVLKPKHQHQLFQFQEKHKPKRRVLNWKPIENSDLIALIKWNKRTT